MITGIIATACNHYKICYKYMRLTLLNKILFIVMFIVNVCNLSFPIINEPVREKTNNLGSEHAPRIPACTVTEDG